MDHSNLEYDCGNDDCGEQSVRGAKGDNRKLLKTVMDDLKNYGINVNVKHPQETSQKLILREKCPYSELFWSVFSCIRTEYGEILHIPPYSVRMRKNKDQGNSEYRHFLRSVINITENKKK